MASQKPQADKLNRFLESVENSLDALSDEEILQNAIDKGIDVDHCISVMRETISNEIMKSRKSLLHKARKAYDSQADAQSLRNIDYMSVPEMIEVLKQAIQGGQLTMANRDLKGYSEDDLRNLINDLDMLDSMNDKEE